MSVQSLSRFGLMLFFLAVLAGCASSGGPLQCRLNPSSCMHEGSYEPGEGDYAEEEAKDLNRESARRVRLGGGWW